MYSVNHLRLPSDTNNYSVTYDLRGDQLEVTVPDQVQLGGIPQRRLRTRGVDLLGLNEATEDLRDLDVDQLRRMERAARIGDSMRDP